jgi:hypothetical protein
MLSIFSGLRLGGPFRDRRGDCDLRLAAVHRIRKGAMVVSRSVALPAIADPDGSIGMKIVGKRQRMPKES